MSDEAIRALERELLRSGKTLEAWALDVLKRHDVFEFPTGHSPGTRIAVRLRALMCADGAWLITSSHLEFDGMSYYPDRYSPDGTSPQIDPRG